MSNFQKIQNNKSIILTEGTVLASSLDPYIYNYSLLFLVSLR